MAGINENTQTDSRIPEGADFSDAKKSYHAVSLFGGKDSTCMLILMIERGMPIDIVLNADTGMDESISQNEEVSEGERPSVLEDLKKRAAEIPPDKKPGKEPERG